MMPALNLVVVLFAGLFAVEVFAAPAILPGDRVEITGLPYGHPAAALLGEGVRLHVRGVRHRLDRQRGALTRLSF